MPCLTSVKRGTLEKGLSERELVLVCQFALRFDFLFLKCFR